MYRRFLAATMAGAILFSGFIAVPASVRANEPSAEPSPTGGAVTDDPSVEPAPTETPAPTPTSTPGPTETPTPTPTSTPGPTETPTPTPSPAADTSAPTITVRTPAINAYGFAVNSNITVVLSEQVEGVDASTFVLRNGTDTAAIAATVTYSATTRTATLDPAAPLSHGTGYLVRLGGIADAAGNPLGNQAWRFTTQHRITFRAGTLTGYKFSSYGAGNTIQASKTATLPSSSSAAAARRIHVSGRGIYFEITNGIWTGFLIRETPSSYIAGIVGVTSHPTPPVVAFPGKAVYTGYRFNAAYSAVSASTKLDLPYSSSARASKSAVINGRGHYLMSTGTFVGYWVPGSSLTATASYKYAAYKRYLWNGRTANVQQATNIWCVPASVWTMLNIIRNRSDGSYSQQQAVYSYGRQNLGYSIRAPGLDPQSWARAMNNYGAGVGGYVDSTYSTYAAMLKAAAKAIAATGKPVGVTINNGTHGWTIVGVTATADPRQTNNYTVTGVHVMAPFRAWTDPPPGTYYSASAFAAKSTKYYEPERWTRWNGTYVLVRPTK